MTFDIPTIEKIASNEILDHSFAWLCKRRENYHFNNDIWHLRTHWDDFKPVTRASLLDGSYMFEPVRMMRTPDGGVCLCSSMDVPVLKGVAIVLNEELRPILGDRCYHIAGMGGDKGAVRDVQAVIDVCKFVFKSDVESYYSSIDHGILMNQVGLLVDDERVLYLVHEYLEHLVDEDGELRLAERGIK